MIGDNWQDNYERVMNVDVRAPREFSHTCTELEREQGRISWSERCTKSMALMREGKFNQLYEK